MTKRLAHDPTNPVSVDCPARKPLWDDLRKAGASDGVLPELHLEHPRGPTLPALEHSHHVGPTERLRRTKSQTGGAVGHRRYLPDRVIHRSGKTTSHQSRKGRGSPTRSPAFTVRLQWEPQVAVGSTRHRNLPRRPDPAIVSEAWTAPPPSQIGAEPTQVASDAESCTSFGTARPDDSATATSLHTNEKPVRALAPDDGRLVSAFHGECAVT